MTTPMHSDNAQARRICGAKTRSGKPCQNRPMANGRCRMHGGSTPNGFGLPQTKTGRYSKYLPGRMLEHYADAINDPELLNLRQEIALAEARITDLLSRVDSGESGKLWKQARAAWQQLNQARNEGDLNAEAEAADKLSHLLVRGQADYTVWHEVMVMIEQRRKLVESERRRLVDMQQMITAEQAMALVSAIIDTVRRNVSDRDTLAAIQGELTQLITR